jgi:deoxyribonuclease V
MTPDQARKIQTELSRTVSRKNEVNDVHLVAGVDISAPDAKGIARAAVVVLSYPELTLVERRVITKEVTFPYVPGLLSFRESPLILAACEELEVIPDLIMVDGQGLAHPRRLGLASHLGLFWDKPTIGCAKSRLCGEHRIVPPEPGSYSNLIDQGEIIGAALRTKLGAPLLYISIGHKIDLNSAVTWVLRCCHNQRLPEPTRLAHLAASGHIEVAKSAEPNTQIRLAI